jgi:hypothetical protein
MAIFMPTITLIDVEDKRKVIEDMLEVLKPLLLTVSLQLNTDKSNVFIRNPLRVEDKDTTQVERYGNERLKVVCTLRILFVGRRMRLRELRRRIRLCK